jgi:hypothetical protein
MSDTPRRNADELGALWNKLSAQDKAYMTGHLKLTCPHCGAEVEQPLVVFREGEKKNERQPDWRILRPKARREEVPF